MSCKRRRYDGHEEDREMCGRKDERRMRRRISMERVYGNKSCGIHSGIGEAHRGRYCKDKPSTTYHCNDYKDCHRRYVDNRQHHPHPYHQRNNHGDPHHSPDRVKPKRRDSHGPPHPYEIDKCHPNYHDKEGHFKYILGESIGESIDPKDPTRRRYKLLDKIGQGTFGRVFSCWDRLEREYVAVKVVRAVKKYTQSADYEILILKKIHEQTASFTPSKEDQSSNTDISDATSPNSRPPCEQHCINLLNSFMYKGHVCMVFPRCGLSLYDFMKQNGYKPFDLWLIKDVAKYLFQSLYYMHNIMNLIHTDLKPENILFKETHYVSSSDYPPLTPPPPPPSDNHHHYDDTDYDSKSYDSPTQSKSRSQSASRRSTAKATLRRALTEETQQRRYRRPASSRIKVIDLGSAIFEKDHHSSVISTRHYRAPEVILKLGWSYPSDIWSVGCILIELLTGNTVFQTHHNNEHLYMMELLLGPFPNYLLINSKTSEKDSGGGNSDSGERSKECEKGSQKDSRSNSGSGERSTGCEKGSNGLSSDGVVEKETDGGQGGVVGWGTVKPKNSTVDKYFKMKTNEDGKVSFYVGYQPKDSRDRKRVKGVKKLEKVINHHIDHHHLQQEEVLEEMRNFHDLVRKTLEYDPEKRITAREALQHPFFQ